jgi:TM2 domain-containing membrane protein YozV
MSETPNHPDGSDPTLRYYPDTVPPVASEPTAPPSDGDLTQRMTSAPPAPAYPGYPIPATQPPPGYGQQPPYGQQAGYGYSHGSTPGYPQQPGYATHDPYGRPLSDKSKVVAGVLGIALGGFGVGRFYTGHVGLGVAQLIVTLATCGLGHFWGLIDGILILVNGGTDAEGRILRD